MQFFRRKKRTGNEVEVHANEYYCEQECCCRRGPRGERGPQGEQGEQGLAATIRIGKVETGEPGTDAQVVNSGTAQDAVLDFVIPRGEPGESGAPVEVLSSYSVPPQPGSSGDPLIFDKNGVTYGNAISHSEGSGDFTIDQPGFYLVSFHGTIGPANNAEFPLAITLFLKENGSEVAGTAVSHVFRTSTEVSNVSFSQIIQVTDVPTTLEMIGEGGNYIYSSNSISINKIGEPSENTV